MNQNKPAYLFGALFGALLLALYNLLRFAYTLSYTHIWLSLLHGALLSCATANLGVLAIWLPWLTYSQPLIADFGPGRELRPARLHAGLQSARAHLDHGCWASNSTRCWRWPPASCLLNGPGTAG